MKRYDLYFKEHTTGPFPEMGEDDTGDYVLYTDVQELEAMLVAALVECSKSTDFYAAQAALEWLRTIDFENI